jgi:hypothetical protein
MPVILEPGIGPALAVSVDGEENPALPVLLSVLLKDGATMEGVSVPIQGADGKTSGDGAMDVGPVGLPGCVVPRAPESKASVDGEPDDEVVDDGVEPHTLKAFGVPDVDIPDAAGMPDTPVEPP